MDSFLGLGNSAIAAAQCGASEFIGFEIDSEYLAVASKRAGEALNPPPAYFHHKDAEQAMTRTTDRAFLVGTRSSIAPTGCKPCFEVN